MVERTPTPEELAEETRRAAREAAGLGGGNGDGRESATPMAVSRQRRLQRLLRHSKALAKDKEARYIEVEPIRAETGVIEPTPVTGPEAQPEAPEINQTEQRLNAARDAFIKAEQNQEKYFGLVGTIRGIFGGKAAAKDEYEKARDEYEKARAELVGVNIKAFLTEETKLTDERIHSATEKKSGIWESVRGAYKWMGEQNLEKLGWKPEGKVARAVARFANLRTAVGAALLGGSIIAGPLSFVAMGAYGVRAGMRGVGTAAMTEEWFKARGEAAQITIKDEELQQMSFETVAKRLGDMAVGLRMQGKLASESADYQRLMRRYEEILGSQYRNAEGFTKELLGAATQRTLEQYKSSQVSAKWREFGRRSVAAAAGVGAAIGVASVLKYLYGAQEAVARGGALAGLGDTEAELGRLAAEGPPTGDLGVIEAKLGEMAAEGLPTGAPTDLGATEAELGRLAAEGTPGGAPSDLGAVEAELGRLAAPPPEEAVAQNLEAIQKAAEAAAEAGPGFPDSFEYIVQSGEGPIHEARKAISEYIAMSADEKLQGLTKAQRILAEEKLYREAFNVKYGYLIPSDWKAGMKVSFSKSDIEGILNEVSGQSPEKVASLGKNLEPFVDRVKWERYDVEPITYEESGVRTLHKPWEWDEGVRRVARKAAGVAAEEKVVHARMVPGFGEVVLEEPRYVSIDIEELPPVHEGMYPAPDELPPVHEAMFASPEEAATLEELILEPESPGLAAAREAALAQQEAVLNASAERLGRALSNLDAEEWGAIRNLRVGDALKKTFWGMTEETRWPGDANHTDLVRKGRLRDMIAGAMQKLSEAERAKAANLTIHQFVKEYWTKGW